MDKIFVTLKKSSSNHADTAQALDDVDAQPAPNTAPTSNPSSVTNADGSVINLAPDPACVATKPLAQDASNSGKKRVTHIMLKKRQQ